MQNIHSPEDLLKKLKEMDKEHSVYQFRVPGKGQFTAVLQEEDEPTIAEEVQKNPELGKMIQESIEDYKAGRYYTTSELLRSLSPEDFSDE